MCELLSIRFHNDPFSFIYLYLQLLYGSKLGENFFLFIVNKIEEICHLKMHSFLHRNGMVHKEIFEKISAILNIN